MDELKFKNENIIPTDNVQLFMCDICNDCYSQERSFKLHYRFHKRYPCEVCHQVFTLKRDLNDHLRTHNGCKQKYTCAECGTELFSKNQVRLHKKWHKDTRYVCKICNAELRGIKKLRGRKIIPKSNVCDGCQVVKEYDLKEHACAEATVQEFKPFDATTDCLKHSDVKHVCSICKEVFDSEAVLKSHSESHEKEKSHSSDTSESAALKRDVNRNTPSTD